MSIDFTSIPDIGIEPLNHVLDQRLASHGDNELWLEFGVWKGSTVNKMAKATSGLVHGFDSFEGLPDNWRDGFAAGTFNEHGRLPPVESNVHLIKGWFSETLPSFIDTHLDCSVSLLHIDCDIYSSTSFVLSSLASFLKKGTIVVFDELINYPGYDNGSGELRAWAEFVETFAVDFTWIGMNGKLGQFANPHEKVALRINDMSV